MSARDIIIRPIVTEKTMKMSSDENANKVSVAQAIKEIYGITAEKVNIVNVHPKTRRVGRYQGKTNAYKKAIVKLPEGTSIDIFGTEE